MGNHRPDPLDELKIVPVVRETMLGRDGLLRRNPLAISVEDWIRWFWYENEEEGWNFTHEEARQLYYTAPPVPEGERAFRWLEIRLGHGAPGVAQTFEALTGLMRKVFGDRFVQSPNLKSGEKYLKLFGGDETHKRGVRWVTCNLQAVKADKDPIAKVRNERSLADSLLTLFAAHPELVKLLSEKRERYSVYAGGYRQNYNLPSHAQWAGLPFFTCSGGQLKLEIGWVGSSGSKLLVPETQGSPLVP